MKRQSRFEKFEPITLRAAARVLHLARTGRLDPVEARRYVRRLAAMDPHAGARAYRRLNRVALRRSCLGNTGAPPAFQMARRARKGAAAGSPVRTDRRPVGLAA